MDKVLEEEVIKMIEAETESLSVDEQLQSFLVKDKSNRCKPKETTLSLRAYKDMATIREENLGLQERLERKRCNPKNFKYESQILEESFIKQIDDKYMDLPLTEETRRHYLVERLQAAEISDLKVGDIVQYINLETKQSKWDTHAENINDKNNTNKNNTNGNIKEFNQNSKGYDFYFDYRYYFVLAVEQIGNRYLITGFSLTSKGDGKYADYKYEVKNKAGSGLTADKNSFINFSGMRQNEGDFNILGPISSESAAVNVPNRKKYLDELKKDKTVKKLEDLGNKAAQKYLASSDLKPIKLLDVFNEEDLKFCEKYDISIPKKDSISRKELDQICQNISIFKDEILKDLLYDDYNKLEDPYHKIHTEKVGHLNDEDMINLWGRIEKIFYDKNRKFNPNAVDRLLKYKEGTNLTTNDVQEILDDFQDLVERLKQGEDVLMYAARNKQEKFIAK